MTRIPIACLSVYLVWLANTFANDAAEAGCHNVIEAARTLCCESYNTCCHQAGKTPNGALLHHQVRFLAHFIDAHDATHFVTDQHSATKGAHPA